MLRHAFRRLGLRRICARLPRSFLPEPLGFLAPLFGQGLQAFSLPFALVGLGPPSGSIGFCLYLLRSAPLGFFF